MDWLVYVVRLENVNQRCTWSSQQFLFWGFGVIKRFNCIICLLATQSKIMCCGSVTPCVWIAQLAYDVCYTSSCTTHTPDCIWNHGETTSHASHTPADRRIDAWMTNPHKAVDSQGTQIKIRYLNIERHKIWISTIWRLNTLNEILLMLFDQC